MTGGKDEGADGKPAGKGGRQARLEQALRANLARRKQQARARNEPDSGGPDGEADADSSTENQG